MAPWYRLSLRLLSLMEQLQPPALGHSPARPKPPPEACQHERLAVYWQLVTAFFGPG